MSNKKTTMLKTLMSRMYHHQRLQYLVTSAEHAPSDSAGNVPGMLMKKDAIKTGIWKAMVSVRKRSLLLLDVESLSATVVESHTHERVT